MANKTQQSKTEKEQINVNEASPGRSGGNVGGEAGGEGSALTWGPQGSALPCKGANSPLKPPSPPEKSSNPTSKEQLWGWLDS